MLLDEPIIPLVDKIAEVFCVAGCRLALRLFSGTTLPPSTNPALRNLKSTSIKNCLLSSLLLFIIIIIYLLFTSDTFP